MLSLLPSLHVLKRRYDGDSSKANKSMTTIIQQPSGQLKTGDSRGDFTEQSDTLPAPLPLFHVTLCNTGAQQHRLDPGVRVKVISRFTERPCRSR